MVVVSFAMRRDAMRTQGLQDLKRVRRNSVELGLCMSMAAFVMVLPRTL